MSHQNPEITETTAGVQSSNPLINDSDAMSLENKLKEWRARQFTLDDLPELASAINSNDIFQQHYGVMGLRKILSEQNPPIQRVIDENLVPRLIEFMKDSNKTDLQLEATWCISNVASGTTQQTQIIVDNRGIPILIDLLRSPKLIIAEQAIWAVGNISGDSAVYRDMLLKEGAMSPLLHIVSQVKDKEVSKRAIWVISNLCKGKPLPKFDLVKSAIPTLYRILQTETDPDVLSDTAWVLSYLSDKENTIDYDLARGVISALLRHSSSPSLAVLIPSIRILGNITQDDAVQYIALENPNYIPTLFKLTCHDNRPIRRESCWNISNITAGTAEQSNAVTGNPYYVDILIKRAQSDLLEVQREALYALINPIDNWQQKQLAELLDLGVLDCFICLLNVAEEELVHLAIEGIQKILENESSQNRDDGVQILKTRGAAKIIESLQNHQNTEISSIASDILMNYLVSKL